MGVRVPAVKTPWAPAWAHAEICVNMDRILRAAGVTSETVRRRMTAHAIVASGWRQAVWCYNAWGVKTGKSWAGDYYEMTTLEDDGTGSLYVVPNDAWRAFPSWDAAVRDYEKRINVNSSRYGEAARILPDPNVPDSEFWAALGRGGYYTDTQNMTPSKFGSLCARVSKELESAPFGETDAIVAEAGAAVALGVGTWIALSCGVAGAVLVAVGAFVLLRGSRHADR